MCNKMALTVAGAFNVPANLANLFLYLFIQTDAILTLCIYGSICGLVVISVKPSTVENNQLP